jgi:hypothetical protein
MAGPITWQNIAAPSYSDAMTGLARAQQSLNSGFDSFNNVIKQQTDAGNANWDQVKKNNTDAFMNQLLSTTTADQFTALRDSGQLQQMLTANGAQIDQAAARAAMDTRLGTLQQRDLTGMQYQKAVEENAQDPIVRQIQMLSLKDPKAAQALLDQNPNLRRGFEVAQGIDTRTETVKQRGREDTKFEWEGKKFGFLEAEERQKEVMRPLDIQAKKAQINASGLSAKEAGLRIQKLEREEADSAQVRALDIASAEAQQAHTQRVTSLGKDMGVIAKGMGLPVTSAGLPDFDKMDDKQIEKYDASPALKAANLPTYKEFVKLDTVAADAFVNDVAASKKFSPAILKKFKDSMRTGFDSSVIGSKVGADAADRNLAAARTEAYFDAQDNKNWYAPNHPQARKGYEELAKDVPNLIDKTSGNGAAEDVADVQALVYEMATKGIDIGGGKFMTPSVEDVRNAVRTAGGGWFFDSTRASNARKILEDRAKSSDVAASVKLGQESEAFRNKQAVYKILNKKPE